MSFTWVYAQQLGSTTNGLHHQDSSAIPVVLLATENVTTKLGHSKTPNTKTSQTVGDIQAS